MIKARGPLKVGDMPKKFGKVGKPIKMGQGQKDLQKEQKGSPNAVGPKPVKALLAHPAKVTPADNRPPKQCFKCGARDHIAPCPVVSPTEEQRAQGQKAYLAQQEWLARK